MHPTPLLSALALFALQPAQGTLPASAELFLAPVEPLAAAQGGDAVLRQRSLIVAVERLADAAAAPGRALELELFDGERWRLDEVVLSSQRQGAASFSGRLSGADASLAGEAVFAVVGDSVAGSLRLGARLLHVEPLGGAAHALVEIDELALPTCGTGEREHVHAGHGLAGTSKLSAGAAAPATVDMMVVYTPQAKNAQGGTNGILARINLAITETNNGYASSDVEQRLRLVHTEELSGYTETGNFSTELGRLRSKTDGWFDSIHPTRDAVGADAVAMIVNGNQYCGIAYLMNGMSHGFEDDAFSVTARSCMTGYYSFGHELGHNFGSNHDKGNSGNGGSFAYSYGWRTANGAYRTVMAYAPGTRVNRWSNPAKTWNGQVLGKAGEAENWLSLNNTSVVTSQWRCAVPEPFGVPKVTSNFDVPRITHAGKPVFDGTGGFQVRVEDAIPNQPAIVFYGTSDTSAPFMGGTLYVGSPLIRLPMVLLDGLGAGAWDFPIDDFAPGDVVYAQGWFRDPTHSDGTGAGLTEGLRIDVCQYAQ